MKYENVYIESITYSIPDEIVTSDEIEARLEPLYKRLRLPEGRLELMTGIRERRFWPVGMLPGEKSIETGEKAITQSGIERSRIGALVHGSVCRDYLEPATAAGVHHGLKLSKNCQLYDVSNACLGLLNGMVQVANMIELGQIQAGLVVGTESSRGLVETTIKQLNSDTSLTRAKIKLAVASMTIGSGSAAILLTNRELSRSGNRLLGGVAHANTDFCHLCRSDRDQSADADMSPLMWTDSETLMQEGVKTAQEAFENFLVEMDWTREDLDRTFCHQVGRAHRKLTFEALQLDTAIDYTTFETLGNTGAVALPMTAARGIEDGCVTQNSRVAFLGIGSGINVLMLGIDRRDEHIS
ncbi:MAG: 3-oxoacyl-ACP synthase III [Pirellulales bacterium]|nr:3-oxoacyl-ACP synthase III [Pirellulales bacterium]